MGVLGVGQEQGSGLSSLQEELRTEEYLNMERNWGKFLRHGSIWKE